MTAPVRPPGIARALAHLLLAGLSLAWVPAAAQAPPPAPADTRRSGSADLSPPLRALEQDRLAGPTALALAEGEARFRTDCQSCHTPASLRESATRHPAWDTRLGVPVTLARRINACRERHLGQPLLPPEHETLLALETYVASLARGLPIRPDPDPRLDAARALGQRLWLRRIGQLDLACAHCHDAAAGRRLAGSVIPQGHPTAYPVYRLEWQGMGSLQRRLRGCASGVRAEPWAWNGEELLALELFLQQRAAGMPLESPGVRP